MKNRLLASLLVIVGIVLSFVMAKQIFDSLAPYSWQKTECLIKRSHVVYLPEEANTCKHSLEYQYKIAGTSKTGHTWRLDPGVPYSWCSDWSSFAGQFPPSTLVDCYFDPKDSDRVVLDRGNLFSLLKLILPFGLLFIGISLLRIKKSVFPLKKEDVKRIAKVIAFCVLLGGIIATYFSGIIPLYQSYDSSSWTKIECEVLSSSLRTSSPSATSPGASTQNRGYCIDIVYTYTINGQAYVSDRYDFNVFGSGKADDLAKITEKYPVGANVSCSVSPNNPYDSVLEPGFSAKFLWGFIPLIAVLVGTVLLTTLRKI